MPALAHPQGAQSPLAPARALPQRWDAVADALTEYDMAGERVRYAAALRPLLSLPRGARILEAGCGSGRLLRALHALGFSNLTALEISARRLEWVRRLGPPGASLHCSDTVRFADASFDAVVTAAVIEHVAQPRHWLANLARVLRPGGVLSLVTDTYMWRWMRRLGMYRTIQPIDDALWPATLVQWAAEAGLVLEKCGGFWNTPAQRWYFLRQLPQLRAARRWRARWAYYRARYGGRAADPTPPTPVAAPCIDPAHETAAVLVALNEFPARMRYGTWWCIWSYECFYWFRRR